jgi:hypothetical protein
MVRSDSGKNVSILIFQMRMIPVWLLLICFLGCSPQKNLAERLKGADRVVVTYAREDLSISIIGEEVDKIIQAIEISKKESPYVAASPFLQFQFYKGKEHLGDVVTAYELFVIDQKPYKDTTGVIKELSERYLKEHPPRLSP